MRICLFTPTFFPEMGGVEMWCDTFARGMIARGHHVVVLAQKMRGNRPMPALPYAVENYNRPPAQHLLAELLSFPLRRSHRQHHFDVVVTNYGYPLAYATSRVKERLGLGLVSVAHGSDLYDGFHALRKPRVKKLIRLGYQRCDQIAAVSQSMADRVHQCIGNCPTPVTVIENAVDIAALRFPANAPPPPVAAELSLTPGNFTIQVAGLRRVKRQDLSITAALENKTFLEQSNLKHVLVGQGALDADYKQLVAQNNLQTLVLFAGLRTGLDKAWLFSNARFLVNSSDEEGLPLVLIEAAASGLPILVSNIQPHLDFLANSGCGQTFKQGDSSDLAAQMRHMITTDLSPLRAAAALRAKDFDLATMLTAYEEICRRAIAARTGVPA